MEEFRLASSLWQDEWRFPSNNNGQLIGISESGVETFKGTPIKSLAREICQNSIDAVKNQGLPARIEFRTFDLKPSEIPRFDQLQNAFHYARQFWESLNNKKASDFFKKAEAESRKEKIRCLRISDFNTTGLTGSDKDYGTPWSNLIKSSGASDKGGVSGGSFGIGKFAPFSCSLFRTVFYSTVDEDGVEASQGVSRLTSFPENGNGDMTQGIGFYGKERNTPIRGQMFLDPDFRREKDDTGTDIYLIGFNAGAGWENTMAASVLDGFLYAVWKGNLVVDIDGTVISQDSLPEMIKKFKPFFGPREYADEYYRVLTAAKDEASDYEQDIEGLGMARLRLMIAPELSRRVAMVRGTGMKIFDKDRINSNISFAGVLYVEGVKLNETLRQMENPEHTQWQPARADDPKYAEKVRKSLFSFIIASFNKQKQENGSDPLDPSVGAYLGSDEKGEQEERKENINDAIASVSSSVRHVVPKAGSGNVPDVSGKKAFQNDPEGNTDASALPGEGSSAGGGHSSSGGGGGSMPGENGGNSPVDHRGTIVEIAAEKRRLIRRGNGGKYRIIFTPSESADEGGIAVYIAAESQNYGAHVKSAQLPDGTVLTVKGNRIEGLNFEASKPVAVDFDLASSDGYLSMEAKAYGHKI